MLYISSVIEGSNLPSLLYTGLYSKLNYFSVEEILQLVECDQPIMIDIDNIELFSESFLCRIEVSLLFNLSLSGINVAKSVLKHLVDIRFSTWVH